MPIDKAILIERCIKGHKKAQNKFYELYKERLFGICIRYAKNKQDAEDIYQEAFIKIFDNLKFLNDPHALDSWVKKTVIRTSINFYHKSMRSKKLDDIENVQVQDDHYHSIISTISRQELIDCINTLPDGYRIVFNLYVIDGFTHKEIAATLGISINTSKSQLHSAKVKLKEKLKELGITRYERII